MRLLRPAAIGMAVALVSAAASATAATAASSFPQYNHVFLVVQENENSNQVIGNTAAPEINALAADYGLATRPWVIRVSRITSPCWERKRQQLHPRRPSLLTRIPGRGAV